MSELAVDVVKMRIYEEAKFIVKTSGTEKNLTDNVIKLLTKVSELEQENKILSDELQNGCNRCTDDCSLSPMSPEYEKLRMEKEKLIEAYKYAVNNGVFDSQQVRNEICNVLKNI